MGTRTNSGRNRRSKRGLASFVSFLLLFAFALGQGSSLFALADGADVTDPVATEDVVADGSAGDGTLPVEEAPAEEAPVEEAPVGEAPVGEVPVVDEGSGDAEASATGIAPVSRTAPESSQLETASAGRGEGILSHGGLHGGDVNLDFVAAGPFTYDHSTGLGAYPDFGYNDRTIDKDHGVVESLEGGDFECDDLVTFFVEVEVEEGAGTGSVALDLSFGAETTGQPGLGFDDIVSWGINTPDDGNVELDGDETVTLSNEHLDTSGYDQVMGTFTVSNLEGGETAIVRVTVHLECEIGATPTGNILNAIEAARVVGGQTISVGQETVPMKQVGGLAAAPAIDVTKDCIGTAAAGEPVDYQITVANTGNVDLTDITVVDDIIGNLSDQFPDMLAEGSDPVTVTVTYTPEPSDGDPVINTVTATGTWETNETSDTVTDTDDCSTDITHAPGILVEKDCPEPVPFSADVTFTITVTNTGNEALENVLVTDELLGGNITADFDFADPFPVGGEASAQFTYTPGAEEDPVENSVTASGDGVDSGDTATSTDACVTDVLNPAIQIEKTVDEDLVPIGTTVTYTFVVKNIGEVTLFNITVVDDIMGPIGEIAILQPGEEATLTKDFVVGDEPVLNVAIAEGEDEFGNHVSDTDDAFVSPFAASNPPNPPNPPGGTAFTGSDAGRLGLITLVLLGVGATVVASTRRRRPEREAA